MSERGIRPARLRWGAAWLAVAALAPAAAGGAPSAPPPAPTLRLTPAAIRMGTFYSRTRVRVEGEAPAGSAVLVVVRGPDEAEFFNRGDRVGPVWLSVDKLHITRVPSVFIRLASGGNAQSALDSASVAAYQLDESAIGRRMQVRSHCLCGSSQATLAGSGPAVSCTTGVEPSGRQLELIRTSYLALKRQEGTYQSFANAIRLDASGEGATLFVAELDWPRRARPGDYRIEVFACRAGAVVGRASTVLPVVQVGLPGRIGPLAASHPTAYGVLAVLAAVVTGFVIDSLLRRRRPRRAGRGPKAGPSSPVQPPEAGEARAAEEQLELVEISGSGRRG